MARSCATGRVLRCHQRLAVAVLAPVASEAAKSAPDDDGVLIEIVVKGTVVRVRGAVTAETLTAVLRSVKATS
jgi:hypothetical protein